MGRVDWVRPFVLPRVSTEVTRRTTDVAAGFVFASLPGWGSDQLLVPEGTDAWCWLDPPPSREPLQLLAAIRPSLLGCIVI